MVIWSGKSPVLTFLFVRVYARTIPFFFFFFSLTYSFISIFILVPFECLRRCLHHFLPKLTFFFFFFPQRLVQFRRDQSGVYIASANRKVVANFGKALASNIDLSTLSASTPRHLNDPLSSHLLRIDMRDNRHYLLVLFSFGDRLQLEYIAQEFSLIQMFNNATHP